MIYKNLVRIRKFNYLLKGKLLKIYLRLLGCKVGKGLKCKQFPIFRSIPQANFQIGDNVNIGFRITFDIQKNGNLVLGNRVNLTQDIIISSIDQVIIEDDCLIAEYVSIRDGDHQFDIGKNINTQPVVGDKIIIGNDVWVAAGCRVLKGTNIPTGCIIAANSLVLKKSELESQAIYGGNPVKKIGKR